MNKNVIAISLLLLAGFLGFGVYYFVQMSDVPTTTQTSPSTDISQTDDTQEEGMITTSVNVGVTTTNTTTTAPQNTSKYCTAEPTTNDMGDPVYPTDPKYGELKFLGELFTADDCSSDRVAQIYGVHQNMYIIGSNLALHANPSPALLQVLLDIGFECSELAGDDPYCMSWRLTQRVSVAQMLQLKPFYKEFFMNDCLLCG